MPYYSQEIIDKAKQVDLLSYLREYEPDELVRISNRTYTTKTHDSLKISNGMWMWWSRGIGGKNAIDYLTKVKGMSFIDAVSVIVKDKSVLNKQSIIQPKKEEKKLQLPPKAGNNNEVIKYLKSRGINENVISFFIEKGFIYQSSRNNNIVFVGFDDNNKPRYAGVRSTQSQRYSGDCFGSDKSFPFRLVNKDNPNIHIFEGAIDLLSYATLLDEQGSDFKSQSLVSLSGIYAPKKEDENLNLPISLSRILNNSNVITVYLHLDNDAAGHKATSFLTKVLSDKYIVKDHFVPKGKDVNDYLCYRKNLPYSTDKEKTYER